MCLSCFHRVVVTAKNPIMSLEDKTPLKVIVDNPHLGRSPRPSVRSFPIIESCNVPITQEQIDTAVDEDEP